jgi:hypothetical protein
MWIFFRSDQNMFTVVFKYLKVQGHCLFSFGTASQIEEASLCIAGQFVHIQLLSYSILLHSNIWTIRV